MTGLTIDFPTFCGGPQWQQFASYYNEERLRETKRAPTPPYELALRVPRRECVA